MPTTSTDLGGLAPESTTGTARRWFSTFVVITGLIGGGALLGYWVCQQQARDDMQAMRRAHLEEIDRLTTAYGRKVDNSASAVTEAAEKATQAVGALEAAAAKKTAPTPTPGVQSMEPRK